MTSSTMVHNKEILKKAAAVLFALLVWQAAAMLLNRDILLVSPIKVAARLGSIWRESYFFPSVWFSFSRIVLGFLLAFLLARLDQKMK